MNKPTYKPTHKAPAKPSAKPPLSPRDKIHALLNSKRLKGLGEAEIVRSAHLSKAAAQEIGQELEAEGRAVILSFDPLFLLSRESLDFLQDKIVKLVGQHHAAHPDELGLPLDKLLKKLEVPKKTTLLALKLLERSGKAREAGGLVALEGFRFTLTPAEETLMTELEQISLRGELDSTALRDIQARERLSPRRMEKLLAVLMERKRIVQGRDGFYVHSGWLDELIAKVRGRAGVSKELTVGDFKQITGLSRKYSIPLLELLDQMGVTRRKGSVREIL